MKIRIKLLLISVTFLLSSFKHAEKQYKSHYNKKFIHSLKDKKGNLLGTVYIEDFKNDVFRKLLITKKGKGKTDTLYFINNYVFKNPKGVDIQFDKKTFDGYKIEYLKDDKIQLFGVGKSSGRASDPVTIIWNYNNKIFEVFQAL